MSRNNDHLWSDDGRTHIHSPIPLIDSAHPVGGAEWKHQCIKHKLVIALEDHRHLQSIFTTNECHSIQQNWIVGSRKKVSVSHLTGKSQTGLPPDKDVDNKTCPKMNKMPQWIIWPCWNPCEATEMEHLRRYILTDWAGAPPFNSPCGLSTLKVRKFRRFRCVKIFCNPIHCPLKDGQTCCFGWPKPNKLCFHIRLVFCSFHIQRAVLVEELGLDCFGCKDMWSVDCFNRLGWLMICV